MTALSLKISLYWGAMMTIFLRWGLRLVNRKGKGMGRVGGGTDREREPPGHPIGVGGITLAGTRM